MANTATIKLFLPLGDPKQVRTAEISNWSGKAVAAPRSELEHFLARPELSRAGVYFLLGTDPITGQSMAYIGEAEVVRDRLPAHKKLEFWSSAIAFISKDEHLTKAHIKYLEGALISEALLIGRHLLANSQRSGAHLPESDQADMDVFLSRIRQLLPVLGTELLTPIVANKMRSAPAELLSCAGKNVKATGFRSPNGFVVLSGSTAVLKERDSTKIQGAWILNLRRRLIDEGALTVSGSTLVFTRDVEFSSPSAAAGVVRGGTAAGPILWKDSSGRTLKDIEEIKE